MQDLTLAQVVEGFFLVRRARLAATTQANYRQCLQRLQDHCGGQAPFALIAPADVRAFLDHLRESGLSERSVHDYLIICSSLWTFAAKEFGLPHVVAGVERPRFRDPAVVPFTQKECADLIRAAEWTAAWSTRTGKQTRSKRPSAKRDLAAILVLLDTGLRASELCGLTLEDYHQDEGRLLVRHGKGDKQRHVYLGDNARRSLWRYILERPRLRPQDPLFVTRSGKAMERSGLRHLLGRVGRNAGIADVYPHRFRHTFAIQFLRNGGNIFELQKILGHETLDTVKVYLQLAEVDIAAAQRTHSPADNWRL